MTAEPNTKRVLLAGASGYIGQEVAAQLVQRGYDLTIVTRPEADPISDPRLQSARSIVVSLESADACRAGLTAERWDVVISCIASRTGTALDSGAVDYQANANLLNATTHPSRHFVLLSAICVQRPRLAFQRAKLKFEAELQDAPGVWTVVRPTAFFKSLAGQLPRLQAGKPFLMFGDGTLTACKPISAADLAGFMCGAIEQPALRNQILAVGGPGPALTPRAQGEMLFELLGATPRFRSVPSGFLAVLAACLAPVAAISKRARQKAELLRIGHYYATESMLVWDRDTSQYSAEATPEYGCDTLRAYYAALIENGMGSEDLGEQKLF
ncbi:MAG: NAD(P)H-binding protein [Pseudomonadales bacterium]